MTLLSVIVLIAIVAPIVALLQRTHRRTAGLPRMPFGLDRDSYLWDARRDLLADLAARPDRSGPNREEFRRAA